MLALMLIAARDRVVELVERAAAPAPTATATAPAASPVASPVPDTETPLVRVAVTSNLYARPDRASEVLAVLPAEQRAAPDGRTSDGEWVRVTYPAGSTTRGWVRASALGAAAPVLAALPSVAQAVATPPASPSGAASGPDLALGEAFLIDGAQLAVAVRNVGGQPVPEAAMKLAVTRAEGDVVGVLTIEPAALDAGASATVVTPLAITLPGLYRLKLEPDEGARDAQTANNERDVLLIPGVGPGAN